MSEQEDFQKLQELIAGEVLALHKRLPVGTTLEKAAQWYRLNVLYWIENEKGEKVKFRATPIQTRFFFSRHSRTVVPKARQVRLSTICALLALDHCLFGKNKTAGVIDLTDEDAKRKLARIRFAYDHMDDEDDPRSAAMGRMVKMVAPKVFDNAHEMKWGNESKIWASTTLRGGTITFLWVTEFGPISCDFPEKADKIKTGALNTIHQGAEGVIESSYKGGRGGAFYDMIRLAQRSPFKPDVMQWKALFYGWQDEPSYKRELSGPLFVGGKYVEYFEKLEKETGRKLTVEQRNWYQLKAEEQGEAMAVEFPGTLEEALRGRVEGSIYGDIITGLRSQGRICEFVPDPAAPLFTSWDVGDSDYTAVWLLQVVNYDWNVLAYHCGHAMTPAQHVAAIMTWEKVYRRSCLRHFLPHDANQKHAGVTWVDQLTAAGLRDIVRVPRVPAIWTGINALRNILGRFRFHIDCDKDIERGETRYPSGLACLEAYKRKVEAAGGKIVEEPVHDEFSHGASALRTIAEAHMRKMLVNIPALAGEQRANARPAGQALMGLREPDVIVAERGNGRTRYEREAPFIPPPLR